jgi:hypothetical protein
VITDPGIPVSGIPAIFRYRNKNCGNTGTWVLTFY